MSDVVQPLIFPEGELEERWRFRRMLEQLIILGSAEAIFDHLDAKVLRDIFEIENGGTVLNAAAVSNLLYAGGFTRTETGSYAEVQGGINFAAFNALHMESKLLLVHRMAENNPRANACRSLVAANKHGQEVRIDEATNSVAIGGSIDWIRVWLQYFTISAFNEDKGMFNSLKWKPDKRVSLAVMHLYYCNVMQYYGKKAVTRKQFRQYLEKLGVEFKKGYAQKTSGVVYADKIWIPNSVSNQQTSISVGYAVIDDKDDYVFTPFGSRLSSGLLDRRNVIFRRLGYDESKEKETTIISEEIPREDPIIGGTSEIREDVTVQTKERIETGTGINLADDVQSEQPVEKTKIKVTDPKPTKTENPITVTPAISDEDTSTENDDAIDEDDPDLYPTTSYAAIRAKNAGSKPKAFIDYDPLDTAANAAFLNSKPRAAYEESDDWGDDGEDSITIEIVLNALRVANRYQKINDQSLQYWSDRMNTSLEELGVTKTQLLEMI